MRLDLMYDIEKLFDNFKEFVAKNADNPLFWIIIFLILLVGTAYFITNFANK